MLKLFSVNGYKVFGEKVMIDFSANNQIKNKDYVFKDKNILKSAIIYGPNNTGKSTFIEALELLKKIIKNGSLDDDLKKYSWDYNFFNEKHKMNFRIVFVENDREYDYILEFEYEKGITDELLKVNNELVFDRKVNKYDDEVISNIILMFSQYTDKIVVSMLTEKYKIYTDDFNNFFDNLIILDKYMDLEDMIKDITDLTPVEMKLFNKIVKSADISIESIEYTDKFNTNNKLLNLISYYNMKGKKDYMPSVISDSDGTKMFMRYILKIIKLKRKGGMLVVDEIDRSLHTLLTKSIISLFNSEDNKNIQLLATSHDLLLLDSKFLFRKDQIWFTYKDTNKVYFYSLNDYKANSSAVRNNTMENYLKGMFGALPHPDIEGLFYE